MKDEKIYSAMIMVEDDSALAECHAIRHEGSFWLVPQWLDAPAKQAMLPERIIRLAEVSTQMGGRYGNREFDLIVNEPVPTTVLYGPTPMQSQSKFFVTLSPGVEFQRHFGLH